MVHQLGVENRCGEVADVRINEEEGVVSNYFKQTTMKPSYLNPQCFCFNSKKYIT